MAWGFSWLLSPCLKLRILSDSTIRNRSASKLETLRFSPQKGTGNFFGRCGETRETGGKIAGLAAVKQPKGVGEHRHLLTSHRFLAGRRNERKKTRGVYVIVCKL